MVLAHVAQETGVEALLRCFYLGRSAPGRTATLFDRDHTNGRNYPHSYLAAE
jgi:hypothetical protein